jgi:hypothetical protein
MFIDFEWRRDPTGTGFRLAAAEDAISFPTQSAEGTTIFAASVYIFATPARHQRIVHRGKRLTSYRPLEKYPDLFRHFGASATTAQGALDFVNRFGPLTQAGLKADGGDNVTVVTFHAKQIGGLLTAYARGDKAAMAKMIGPKGKEIGGSDLGTIKPKLVFDAAGDAPELRLTVENLLTALWLQVALTLTDKVNLRACQHCHTLFKVGPGTGRRADAKFCSDEHRTIFNSHKRTKGPAHA